MLTGNIDARQIGELPALTAGTHFISPFVHPLVGILQVSEAGRWAIVIHERIDNNELQANSVTEAYRCFEEHDGEIVIIEAAFGDGGFVLRCTYNGSGVAPIYFHQQGGRIIFDWDSSRLSEAIEHRRLDFQYICRSITSGIYSHRTPWENMHLLPPGGQLSWNGSLLTLNIIGATDEVQAPLAQDASSLIIEHVERHLLRRNIPGVKVACEVSGGMDSAVVALCAMRSAPALRVTLGIDIGFGTARQEQLERRKGILRWSNVPDYLVDIKEFMPNSALSSRSIEAHYLLAEEYENAFTEIWQHAINQDCNVLIGGYGGDELFPTYMSEEIGLDRLRTVTADMQRARESAFKTLLTAPAFDALTEGFLGEIDPAPLATSSRISAQRRAPLLLGAGFWPVFPLYDRQLAFALRGAPLADRFEKAALRRAIGELTGGADLYANYEKETLIEATDKALEKDLPNIVRDLRTGCLADVGIVNPSALDNIDVSQKPWPSVLGMCQAAEKFLRRSL